MSTSLTPFDDARTKYFELTLQGLKINGKPPISICEKYLGTIDNTEANVDKMKNACQLARADLLVFVEENYPDQLDNMLDSLELSMGSYRNMKSVARAFPLEEREPGVTYGHMQALQKVKDKKKRKSYIDKIKSKEIKNVHHLRSKIKIAEIEEDHAPSLREMLETHPKPELVSFILCFIEAIDHEANISVKDDVRGAFMAFGLKIEEKIRR